MARLCNECGGRGHTIDLNCRGTGVLNGRECTHCGKYAKPPKNVIVGSLKSPPQPGQIYCRSCGGSGEY